MEDFDRIEQQLRSASDGVQRLDPGDGGGIEVARTLARHRANRRRALASVTAIAVVVGGVAVAAQLTDDDDSTPLATTGVTTKYVKPTTTETFEKTTTSSTSKPTTSTSTKPVIVQEKPTSTTTSTTSKTPVTIEPPQKTTTTTTLKPTARPPSAYAVSEVSGEVQAVEGSSCWRGSAEEPAVCADTTAEWADEAPLLPLGPNGLVKFRWDTKDQPRAVEVYVFPRRDGTTDFGSRQDFTCAGGNPCKMALKLAPGEYVVMVQSFWSSGDVSHGIRVKAS